MSPKSFAVLAMATAASIGLAAYAVAERDRPVQITTVGEPLFPGLLDRLNDVREVRIVTPEGKLSVVARDMSRPNGVALSPDERTLYVGSTDRKEPWIKAYPLNPDGSVGEGRVFFDGSALFKAGRRGGFDGLKVDAAGNVWSSGPGGVVIVSSGGKHLGSILTGRATANCAFGDADHQTFYITADEALLRVRTKVKGAAR